MANYFTLSSGDLLNSPNSFGIALGNTDNVINPTVSEVKTTEIFSSPIQVDSAVISAIAVNLGPRAASPTGNLTLKINKLNSYGLLNPITDKSIYNNKIISYGNVDKVTIDPFKSDTIVYYNDYRANLTGDAQTYANAARTCDGFTIVSEVSMKNTSTNVITTTNSYAGTFPVIPSGNIILTNSVIPKPQNKFYFETWISLDLFDINTYQVVGTNYNSTKGTREALLYLGDGSGNNVYLCSVYKDQISGTGIKCGPVIIPPSFRVSPITAGIGSYTQVDTLPIIFGMDNFNSFYANKNYYKSLGTYTNITEYNRNWIKVGILFDFSVGSITFVANGKYCPTGTITIYLNGAAYVFDQSIFTTSTGYNPLQFLINQNLALYVGGCLLGPYSMYKNGIPSNFKNTLLYKDTPDTIRRFDGSNPIPAPKTQEYPYNPSTDNGSVYFKGIGNYLTINNSLSLNLSANNFVVDNWLYLKNLPPDGSTIEVYKKVNSNDTNSPQYKLTLNKDTINNPSVLLTFNCNLKNSSQFTLSNNIAYGRLLANRWYHMAVAKNLNNYYLYLNGYVVASATNANPLLSSDGPLIIGDSSNNKDYYLSDFRMTVGSNTIRWGTAGGTSLNYNGTYYVGEPLAPALSSTNTYLLLRSTIDNAITTSDTLTSETYPVNKCNNVGLSGNYVSKNIYNWQVFNLTKPLSVDNQYLKVSISSDTTAQLSCVNSGYVIGDVSNYNNNNFNTFGKVYAFSQAANNQYIKFENDGQVPAELRVKNQRLYELGYDNFNIETALFRYNSGNNNKITILKNCGVEFGINTNNTLYFVGGGRTVTSTRLVPIAAETHLCVLADAYNIRLYIDGLSAGGYGCWTNDFNNVYQRIENDPIVNPEISICAGLSGYLKKLNIHKGTNKYGVALNLIGTGVYGAQAVSTNNSIGSYTVLSLACSPDSVRAGLVSYNGLKKSFIDKKNYTLSADAGFNNNRQYVSFTPATVNPLPQGFSIPHDDMFNISSTTPFTIEAWFKPNTIATSYKKYFLNKDGSYAVGIDHSSNCLIFATSNAVLSTSEFPAFDAWNHIAIVNDGKSTYYYLNGGSKQLFRNNPSYSINPSVNPLYVGGLNYNTDAGTNNARFDGSVSDLKITRSALYTNDTISLPAQSLQLASFGSVLFSYPYTYYTYNPLPNDVHIGGNVSGPISISASNVATNLDTVFIQSSGNLIYDPNSNVSLKIQSGTGLQINPLGTVTIGSNKNSLIQSGIKHNLFANIVHVNSLGGLTAMGLYKNYKGQFGNSIAANAGISFTVTSPISSIWKINDTVLLSFSDKTNDWNNLETLTISAFTDDYTFRTTAKNTRTHNLSAQIPSVINLNKDNVYFNGLDSTYRLAISALQDSNVSINNSQFSNTNGISIFSGLTSLPTTKSTSNIVLSSNSFYDDGTINNDMIKVDLTKHSNVQINDNIFYKVGNNPINLNNSSVDNVNLNSNVIIRANEQTNLSSAGIKINNVTGAININDTTILNSRTQGLSSNVPINVNNLVSYSNLLQGIVSDNIVGSNVLTHSNYLDGILVNNPLARTVNVKGLSSINNSGRGLLIAGPNATLSLTATDGSISNNANVGLEGSNIVANISSIRLVTNSKGGISATLANGNSFITNVAILTNTDVGMTLSGNGANTFLAVSSLSSLFNGSVKGIELINLNGNLSSIYSLNDYSETLYINSNNLRVNMDSISSISNKASNRSSISLLSTSSNISNLSILSGISLGLRADLGNSTLNLSNVRLVYNTQNLNLTGGVTMNNVSSISSQGIGMNITSNNLTANLSNIIVNNSTQKGLYIQNTNLNLSGGLFLKNGLQGIHIDSNGTNTNLTLVSAISNNSTGVHSVSSNLNLNNLLITNNSADGLYAQSNAVYTNILNSVSSLSNTSNGVNVLCGKITLNDVVANNNKQSGMLLNSDDSINITNAVANSNSNYGINSYKTYNLSKGNVVKITNTIVNANSSTDAGLLVATDGANYNRPLYVDYNTLTANDNYSGYGIKTNNSIGSINNVVANNNYIGGVYAAIVDGETVFSNITSYTAPIVGKAAVANYGLNVSLNSDINSPLIFSNVNLSATNATLKSRALFIDNNTTKTTNNLSIVNSNLSGLSALQINLPTVGSNVKFNGSYLISNVKLTPDAIGVGDTKTYTFNNTNPLTGQYNEYAIKNGGFAFVNKNQVAGDHRTFYAHGVISNDTTVYYKSAPSERLTPNSATLKLRGGSKFVALSAGQTVNISVYVAASNTYNGNNPRLIIKSNSSIGYSNDYVLDQLDVKNPLNIGGFVKLGSTIPIASTGNGILEFYVDCDGTKGYVNVEDWKAV